MIKLSSILRNPANPRTIRTARFNMLVESIRSFPQMMAKRPIVIDSWENPIALGGNQRRDALEAAGYTEIPDEWVTTADGWTEEQKKEFIIRDNVDFGEWDETALQTGGWNTEQLAAWGVELPEAASDADALEEDEYLLPDTIYTKIKPGDIIQIGRHRLMCGDSTEAEQVRTLMNGKLADLTYTDPPYGVSYAGVPTANQTYRFELIRNDELRGDALIQFLAAAFENMRAHTTDIAAAYVWYASRTHIQFETALNACGFTVKQQLIWNKGMVLGRSDYHWAHEPLIYCKKTDSRTEWYGDRSHKTILGERRTELKHMRKDELLAIINALLEEQSVWEIDRDNFKAYQHPTQKPVALAGRAITNSSAPGQAVLDLFGGSGAMMVAAEQLDRTA